MEKEMFNKTNILELSPLTLAFIGDGVHTLFVREYYVNKKTFNTHNEHVLSAKICCAKNQAETLSKLEGLLTEEELSIEKRARNVKQNHSAKNSSLADYKKATAYEAIIGYNHLLGNKERTMELLNKSLENM